MKRRGDVKRRTRYLLLFVASLSWAMLFACGGGAPGSPGTSGGSEAESMLLVESVVPSNTYVTTADLTSTETVEVTIGNYDLPNFKDTASAINFTKYTVEYKPMEPGCPFLDNRYYNGIWFVGPQASATFKLAFFDFYTKLQYRYPNDPAIYRYNVIFTLEGVNVFGEKVTVTFQFEITTKK